MGRFLERVNSKVNEFTKDSYKKAMSKIIASVMPKKTKNGAPQKSRALDAEATKTVLSIAESMSLKEDGLNGRLASPTGVAMHRRISMRVLLWANFFQR